MRYYLDIDTGQISLTLGGPVVSTFVLYLRDKTPIELVYVQAGEIVTDTALNEDTVRQRIGLKSIASSELLAGVSTYSIETEEAVEYSAALLSLNSTRLIDYFAENVGAGQRDATLLFEVETTAIDFTSRVTRLQLNVTVRRDVLQPNDEDPIDADEAAGRAETAAADAAAAAVEAAESATAAAASAAAAAASASSASTSAAAAEASKLAAQTAQAAAETARNAAQTAQAAAAVSAAAAAASQAAAATSETNAASSNTAAQAAKTAAEAAQVAAAASQSAAAASAAAALASQTSAAASATTATAQAAAAASSASAAAASATTALNAIISTYKGTIAASAVPATSTAAGDYYRISTAGNAGNVTAPVSNPALSVGDWIVYNGSSGNWTRIPAGAIDESRVLSGDNTRRISPSILSDGSTSNRRIEATPGSTGNVAALPTNIWVKRLFVPTSNPSVTGYIWHLASANTDPSTLPYRLIFFLTASGELALSQGDASPASSFRRLGYAGFRAAYSGRWVQIVVAFTAGDSTTAPTIWIDGVDVTASFALTSSGTVPNWMPTTLDCTKFIVGYNWPSGEVPEVEYGPGSWTAAEALTAAQTGLAPAWWRRATGSVVPSYSSDFSAGVDSWAAVGSEALAGNIDSIGGRDDSLRVTAAASLLRFVRTLPTALVAGMRYELRMSVYRPAANVSAAKVDFENSAGSSIGLSAQDTTGDTWVDMVLPFTATAAATGIRLVGRTSGGSSTVTTGDILYLRGVAIRILGPVSKPVQQPGVPVLTDSGENRIPSLLTAGMTAVGDKPEVIAIPIQDMTADGFIVADQALVPGGYEPFACSIERTVGASTGTITIRKTSSGGTTLFTGTLAATVSLSATIVPFASADKLHLTNSSWSSSTIRGRVLCRRALN